MNANKKILLKGLGASPGTAVGFARICREPSEIPKKFKTNDILVTTTTDPKWTIYMKRAKAIITEVGGILSHAAITAREFRIPCIVGTGNATEVLKDGMKIEVDGLKGLVFEIEE